MKQVALIFFILLSSISYAIKPTRTYSNTPEKMALEHEALRIETKDGVSMLPRGKADEQQSKVFDCEHISGFFKYPVEYTESIVRFLE